MNIDWIKDYDDRPIVEKSKIKWAYTKDFEVQSKYIVEFLRSSDKKLGSKNDAELLSISQGCYNLISWSTQMAVMGFTGFQQYLDELLLNEFNNKYKIADLQTCAFSKWLSDKNGSFKLGENYFTILDNKAYYRKLDGSWWSVMQDSVFNIFPVLDEAVMVGLVPYLESLSHTSEYELIYQEWIKAEYNNAPPRSHYDFQDGITTPDEQHLRTHKKIREILQNPVSTEEILTHGNLDIDELERLIKLSYFMVRATQVRRMSNEHTVYLLRDCVMFDEVHTTLDMLDQRTTSSDRLIVCRDLLSNNKRRGGHWYFVQEALFVAFENNPKDYAKFYQEFSNILHNYEQYSEDFRSFLRRLAVYVDEHLGSNDELTVNFVDLGFQGSINILLRYVVENHSVNPNKHRVNIHMTVVAEWFKDIYKGMYYSDTYSLLTVIESLGRNEHMYKYVLGSFDDGVPLIQMQTKEAQNLGNTELLVCTMVTLISSRLKLV